MANRKNTFLLKRSNVVNKVPSLGDIQLGEIALNTADAKLFSTYTGGLTGATEIREIGWDRLSTISGGTVNGDVIINANLTVTGDTQLVNVSGTSFYTDYIDFNNALTPLPADLEGRIYWDDDNGSLSLGMHGGQVIQQIGLEKYYYVKNQSGATIDNGRVVRAAGTLGSSGRILGEYMIADGTIPPKFTLGIATENIVNGDDGYVTEFGLVRGIDASGSLYGESWSGGTILYVSPTIPGGLTSVEPTAPDLKIEMAIVIDADANGSIFVRPSRYPYLYDLQQVNYSAGTENNLDILQWNSSNLTWDKTNTPSFSGLTVLGDLNVDGLLNIGTLGTGTSVTNLGIDSNGNVVTGTTGGGTFTGNTSGDCITDLYVTNLYGCSPLHIEPSGLNDVYIVENGGNVGIGTSTPIEKLHIDNGDILVTDTNGSFSTDIQNSIGPLTLLSGATTELTRFGVITPIYGGVTFGIRGASEPSFSSYGKQGDAFIYSSAENNGFNIVSRPGTGTDDYVRFFVGQSAGAAGTPDLYIQGSGTTRGNVGINTDTPTEKLHVNGNTKISGSLNIGNILGNTPIGNLGFDSSGNVVSGTTGGGGGESNTASNVGVGEGIFAQKVGVDLQFKSLTSSGNTISISSNDTIINLEKNNQVSVVSVNSSYSATTTDEVIGVDTSSNPVTIYLPDSSSSGTIKYDIKDIGLNSLTNNITVLASGTDTIITSSSVSSIVLSNNGINITLINNGSGQWWQI